MSADAPTIVATCGGLNPGQWSDAVYGPLVLHAIERAGVVGRAPRVAHVNTAGGDQRFVEGQELEAARLAGVDASHLRLFPRRNIDDLEQYVLSQDVVWVSGGSLVNLLAVWRAHGLDDVLRRAWQSGVVLAGGSAGAICWHAGGVTTSFGPTATAVADGLGLLPTSLGVHDDSDATRRPAFRAAVASGTLPDGHALDEGTGIVYSGAQPVDFVSEAPGRLIWRVTADVEHAIEPRLL
ncbi:peptidase E [soil metagenome]